MAAKTGHGGARPGAGRPRRVPAPPPEVGEARFTFRGLRLLALGSVEYLEVQAPGPLTSLEVALAAARAWLSENSAYADAAELLVSGASERGDLVAFGRLHRWHRDPETLGGALRAARAWLSESSAAEEGAP